MLDWLFLVLLDKRTLPIFESFMKMQVNFRLKSFGILLEKVFIEGFLKLKGRHPFGLVLQDWVFIGSMSDSILFQNTTRTPLIVIFLGMENRSQSFS